MLNTLEIRTATLADAAVIAGLIIDTAQACFGKDAPPFINTLSPAILELSLHNPCYYYVLGLLGTEVVGVAALRDYQHVYHLFVSTSYQRRGIARALWQFLMNAATAKGTREFTVNASLYSVPAYLKFGFSPSGDTQIYNGIQYLPMQLTPT